MKHCYSTIFLFHLTLSVAFAQQHQASSFFLYNWQVINPAALDNESIKKGNISTSENGLNGNISSATARFNLVGNETQLTVLSTYEKLIGLGKKKNFRMGLVAGFNKVLDNQVYTGKANFAYLLRISSGHFLNIGFNIGGEYNRINNISDRSDFRFRHTDEFEATNSITQVSPNASFGLFYSLKNLHIGLSLPELFEKNARFAALTMSYEGGAFEPMLTVRYMPTVSIYALNSKLPVAANFNIRYHIREYQTKGKGRPTGHEKWYFGAGYGTNSILNLEIGRFMSGYKYRDNVWRMGANFGIPIAAKNDFGRYTELNVMRFF